MSTGFDQFGEIPPVFAELESSASCSGLYFIVRWRKPQMPRKRTGAARKKLISASLGTEAKARRGKAEVEHAIKRTHAGDVISSEME